MFLWIMDLEENLKIKAPALQSTRLRILGRVSGDFFNYFPTILTFVFASCKADKSLCSKIFTFAKSLLDKNRPAIADAITKSLGKAKEMIKPPANKIKRCFHPPLDRK